MGLCSVYQASVLIILIWWFTSLKGGSISGAGAMTSSNLSCHHSHNFSNSGSITDRLPQFEQLGLHGHPDLTSGHSTLDRVLCTHVVHILGRGVSLTSTAASQLTFCKLVAQV